MIIGDYKTEYKVNVKIFILCLLSNSDEADKVGFLTGLEGAVIWSRVSEPES